MEEVLNIFLSAQLKNIFGASAGLKHGVVKAFLLDNFRPRTAEYTRWGI
jgi:hypothetical protein